MRKFHPFVHYLIKWVLCLFFFRLSVGSEPLRNDIFSQRLICREIKDKYIFLSDLDFLSASHLHKIELQKYFDCLL